MSDAIIGGIIGSIFTVLISKILDIFQKSKDHKYSLEKIFFEKKLYAAEVTITQYTIFSSAISNFSILFERIQKEATSMEQRLQDAIYNQAMSQIKIADQASFVLSNSIQLYFDLKTQFDQNKIINEFFNQIGQIQILVDRNAGEEDINKQMQIISNSYASFDIQIKEVIKEISNEMKRFDYK